MGACQSECLRAWVRGCVGAVPCHAVPRRAVPRRAVPVRMRARVRARVHTRMRASGHVIRLPVACATCNKAYTLWQGHCLQQGTACNGPAAIANGPVAMANGPVTTPSIRLG